MKNGYGIRYGHLNFKSLSMMNAKEIVYGLPQIKAPKKVCRECYESKQARNPVKHDLPLKAKQNLWDDITFEQCYRHSFKHAPLVTPSNTMSHYYFH